MNKSLLAALITTSLAATLAAAPMAGAADDYFLKINGISGESAAGKVTDAIQINGFDLSVENSMTMGSASGGMGAGKAKLNELTIEKNVDSTTPLLFQKLANGTPLKGMELIARKAGPTGAGTIYQRYYFNAVFVTSQRQRSDGESVTETLELAYGAMQMTNVRQTPPAGQPANVFASWNQTTNTDSMTVLGFPVASNPSLF